MKYPMIDRKRFCQILDALGCSCSPPVPGSDTGWSLNPYCLMHGDTQEGPNNERRSHDRHG